MNEDFVGEGTLEERFLVDVFHGNKLGTVTPVCCAAVVYLNIRLTDRTEGLSTK